MYYTILYMSIYKRKQCSVTGCKKLGRNKGKRKEKIEYGLKCSQCHRNRKFSDREFGLTLSGIPNPKCERCGWGEAPCDRHKKQPELGYLKDNVVILCPNCHRLVTQNLIVLDQVLQ